SFTITVLLTLEALGFCGKGEGGPFVEGGRLTLEGSLPTNTDGGGLSSNHPGMRGLFLIVEAARQLRGEAEGRQVQDAKLAAVNENDLPPFNERVPYVVAIVELDEGVRMTSNVEGCAPQDVRCGMPVRVSFREETRDDQTVALPIFVPIEGSAS